MDLQKLIRKLKKIKALGFVPTHRANDTGIGKTLEDLLKIKENNLRLPDVGVMELKAKRLDSDSMLTLATKSPMPRGANRVLSENYKYIDKEGHFNLHSTVYGSRFNPQGLKIIPTATMLKLENKNGVDAYWPITTFDEVLKLKSNQILLVFADTKGERKTPSEKFHFVEAYLLSDLNIKKFKTAILQDKLKIDIRIGVYRTGKFQGRYHDHGTGFRIHKRDLLHLFDNYNQLI